MIPPNEMQPYRSQRGYTTFPGEYNHHTAVWVCGPMIATFIQRRGEFFQLLVDGRLLWFGGRVEEWTV